MSLQIIEVLDSDTDKNKKNDKLKQAVKRNKGSSASKNTLANKLESNNISDIDKYRLANPTHTILLWEKVNYDKHGNVINTEKIATNFESIASFIVGQKIMP